MTTTNNAAQPVLTDDEIQVLWGEACKDSPKAPGWNRHIRFARAIESALLSKLRAEGVQAGDERATAPLCHVRPVGDGWQVCPSTHPDARAVSPVDAPHDSDSVCAWRVWWDHHKGRYTTARQASFAAFAAGKEWHASALASTPVAENEEDAK